MERSHQPRREKNQRFKIYVAGAQSATKPEDIFQFFSRLGHIWSVKPHQPYGSPIHLMHQNSGASQTKGCFILEVSEESVYEHILHLKIFQFKGRNLFCTQFLSGKKLMSTNFEKNKRRVILKSVPAEINESYLKGYLESNFGKVECLFVYKPDSQKYESSYFNRKHRTFNVMFERREDARRLTENAEVYINSRFPISVEKYKFKSLKPKETAKVSAIQVAKAPRGLLGTRRSCGPLKTYIDKSFLWARVEPVRFNSMGHEKSNRRSTKSEQEFFMCLYEASHHCKPGSKGYAFAREKVSRYQLYFRVLPREFLDQNFVYTMAHR